MSGDSEMIRAEMDEFPAGEKRLANLAIIKALTLAQEASVIIKQHLSDCTESSKQVRDELKDLRKEHKEFKDAATRGLIFVLLTIVGAMVLQIALSKHLF